MKFTFTSIAEEHFKRLTPQMRKRVAMKMRFYADQPNPLEFAERLTGSESYRFRIGDYRVIFEVANEMAWVLAIKRRDQAYR
jgi:mRNA interferase RelE/StbE